MQVYRAVTPWSSEEQFFHLIEKKGWVYGAPGTKPSFVIETWCDGKFTIRTGDDYTEYVREKHRKEVCAECVRMIKLSQRGGR